MSKREDIAAHIVTQLGTVGSIKTVTREPKDLGQLAATSFPHVLVESANEVREDASFSGEVRREATLDFLLNIVVYGNDRDTNRNAIIEAVEEKLALDPSMGGNAFNSGVSEVIIREIAETAPYGQAAIVYTVKYYYDRGNA
jgi:hypothetical protein